MRKINSDILLKKYINKFSLEAIINREVKKYIELHEFDEDEMIVNEGDESKYYYLLIEGKAKVYPASEHGKNALLDFLEPLDLIGDIEYVFKSPSYHGVVAIKKTLLLAIPLFIVDTYLNDNLEFHRFISTMMARKIRSTSIKYSRTMLYPLKNRLASYIYEHCDDGKKLIIKIRFNESADYFAISTRHLRRIISEFEDEGILIRIEGGLEILDINKLKETSSYL